MSAVQSITTSTIWREHPVYDGFRASTCGRVQTQWRKQGAGPGSGKGGCVIVRGSEWRYLRSTVHPSGYHAIHLKSGQIGKGKRVLTYVHRIVLECHVGMAPSGTEARHLDGNRSNNVLSNLAWGTKRENAADQARHGTRPRGARHGIAKLTEDKVAAARVLAAAGWTVTNIADLFGVSVATVTAIQSGKIWTHVSPSGGAV